MASRTIYALLFGQLATEFFAPQRQSAHAAFDDDDGAVDDEAEVDGTEAHEVGRYIEPGHPGQGGEHRQRDCR